MNTKTIIAAVSFSLASAAGFAQEIVDHDVVAPNSTLTRAEVKSQIGQTPIAWGELAQVNVDAPAVKTRAQVRAETREAIRLGAVAHGDVAQVNATPAQLEAIARAGERARDAAFVAAR